MGFYHSGIEISGREYSYGSGVGSGIFDHSPRQAPNAKFRCAIELGSYDGGTDELNRTLDTLRHDLGFGDGLNYNVIRRNCNHFCNALSWQLLKIPIPSWINRMAAIGDCCSCLLPKQLLDGSPVGGNQQSTSYTGSSKSFPVPTHASMNRGGLTKAGPSSFDAFAGKGQSLGGSSSSRDSTNLTGNDRTGLFSRWSASTTETSTSSSSSSPDDLTDRREKARKAALARLESSKQATL